MHVAGALSRELFKESMSELSYQSHSTLKPVPQGPRGLALAIAMAGSTEGTFAAQLPSHAVTTIESAIAPTAFEITHSTSKADDDSDDSGDDDF